MRAMLLLGALATPVLAKDPLIEQAIEQLMRDDEDSKLAERVLAELPDRAAVIEAAERALGDEKAGIAGKRRVLWLLFFHLKEGDRVAKALESPVLSTRRAAAEILAGLPAHREAVNPILLAWLAEASPPDARLLVTACTKAKLDEARPWLLKLLDAPDTSPEVFAGALAALSKQPPPELAAIVKRRLADTKEDPVRIAACIDAIAQLPDVNADEVLLPWLKQREHRIVRLKANLAIRDQAVHRQIVLDPEETDAILQRQALLRLLERLDDAPLLELLRDRRVNRHRYFAVRVDVCTALAAIEGSGPEDVPLLLDYLVDDDAEDKTHIVRSEAWLTLWTLTGKMHGAEGDFAKAPGRGGRDYRATRMRPDVTPAQGKAIERLAQDLDHMRKVREAYASAK